MAPLPPNELLTLRAIWTAWEAAQQNWDSIGISMSALGSECDRQIWMDFRWVSPAEYLTGQKLRLFETGHQQETRLIADLRKVPGVTVWDTDPDRPGKQWKVYSHGGHVRGKLDGVAEGLPDAPKAPHVVECKSHNKKNFDELVKKRAEGKGLKEAKIAHWYQCQKYMQLMQIDRCLYMAVCKDNDDLYLERIKYDPIAVAQLDARLERIIGYNRPPSRIAENPGKYPCMFCRHKGVCHTEDFGRINCRTCVHSTPVIVEGSNDATWTCAKHGKNLTVDEQRAGCEYHLFLPDVVPGEQIDAGDDWVAYTLRDGKRWVNQEKKAAVEPEQIDTPQLRYFWNQATQELLKADAEDMPTLDGFEELTAEEFAQAAAWLAEKENASQLGTEHDLQTVGGNEGVCIKCLGYGEYLTTECPNHELTDDQSQAVGGRKLDYRNGQWLDTTAKAEAAE